MPTASRASQTDQTYRVFGLSLRSQIALPELESGTADAPGAIEIVTGSVPSQPGGEGLNHWLTPSPGGAVLSVTDVARFHILGGHRIVVDADPAASDRNVRLYLLGSAMGALLHQRGMLPLHANAIEIGGRAIAFMGHSGAGKSTLAASFQDRGYRILSDDVCVVTAEGGDFIAQPGIPRLRLWRDAVERSGLDTADYERAFDSLDKYTLHTRVEARAGARPLGAVLLLTRHDGQAPAAIHRLEGTAALQALIENTYRGGFIAMTGDARRHFQACLALSRQVPLFTLSRPWDTARIDETMAAIETQLGVAAPEPTISAGSA